MLRRKRRKIQWLLTAMVTIFVSGTIMYKIECLSDNHQSSLPKFPKKSLMMMISLNTTTESLRQKLSTRMPVYKHVTKSLKQLGKMDDVNKYFLFLNSVPNSGAEILVFLLERIQGVNNFKHVRLKGGNKRKLTIIQQEEMVDEIYNIRRNLPIPLSFDRTVYFVNFTSFDKQLPVYVNLIRHPVEKVMSRAISKKTGKFDAYFMRCLLNSKRNCNFKSGRPYDLTIPYFCGHDPRCMILNDQWALDTAKRNIEKYYKVVGVLEELNVTLNVLEQEVPQFFQSANKVYQQYLLDNYKHKKEPTVPTEARDMLEKTLVNEMEFYNWVKNRLSKQSNENLQINFK